MIMVAERTRTNRGGGRIGNGPGGAGNTARSLTETKTNRGVSDMAEANRTHTHPPRGNLARGIDQLIRLHSHPDFMRPISDGVRRERKPLDHWLAWAVLKRDDDTCQQCRIRKSPAVFMHIDHVLPAAAGGSDRTDNLRVLCEPCNVAKSNLYTSDVFTARPRLIVSRCHLHFDGARDVKANRMVFCARCKALRSVEAEHAERYELSKVIARRASA